MSPAEIRRVDQRRAVRRKLRDEGIRRLGIIVERRGGRKVERIGQAGNVHIPGGVEADSEDFVVRASAEVGRIQDNRIDDERRRSVVGADAEADTVARQHEFAFHRLLFAAHLLVRHRTLHPNRAGLQIEHKIALVIEVGAFGTFDLERNPGGVRRRRDNNVELELAIFSVEHDVDAWIHFLVSHARVAGDVALPLGLCALQVMRAAWQLLLPSHGG